MRRLTGISELFFRHEGQARERPARTTSRRARAAPHRRPVFEPLENRILLSVDLIGVPDWVEQGPGPMQSAQVTVPPGDFATGAVESIAINPNDTSQIYVGTVNGGVWRTDNADPSNPDATVWTPLTDLQGSLAMGDIAFCPLDASGDTLFAGTGSFSSLSQSGGRPIGVLRTTDGGATWETFALNPGGSERQVKALVPTEIDLDPGAGVQEVVLAGTVGGGGLYRSDDNGETYSLLSGANGLPFGDISQLIVDPNNAQRFYACVPDQGVFRGDFDSGTGLIGWTTVNTGLAGVGTAGNIQIAGRDSGGTTVLFALLSGPSQGAFRSTTDGDSWTALATPPTLFQRDVTVRAGNTIIVDPTDDDVAYIATYGGGNDIFRYNPAGAGRWDVTPGRSAARRRTRTRATSPFKAVTCWSNPVTEASTSSSTRSTRSTTPGTPTSEAAAPACAAWSSTTSRGTVLSASSPAARRTTARKSSSGPGTWCGITSGAATAATSRSTPSP
jgi:hypothetical protein